MASELVTLYILHCNGTRYSSVLMCSTHDMCLLLYHKPKKKAERFTVAIDEADPARSNGLSPEEATLRLQQEGKNSLTPPTGQNPFLQYLKLLKDPLTAMLLAAAILSLCSQAASTSDYSASYLGGTLLFVVTLNTMVDFIQARKSEAMVKVRTLFLQNCLGELS
jgi:magnesium-transporting ATPase (P-type)